jgi:hypothetical protein
MIPNIFSTPFTSEARKPEISLSRFARMPTSRCIRGYDHKGARIEIRSLFDMSHILKTNLNADKCLRRRHEGVLWDKSGTQRDGIRTKRGKERVGGLRLNFLHDFLHRTDRDNASPSRRICRRSKGLFPWEVSFRAVADKLDNFCATYAYLTFH